MHRCYSIDCIRCHSIEHRYFFFQTNALATTRDNIEKNNGIMTAGADGGEEMAMGGDELASNTTITCADGEEAMAMMGGDELVGDSVGGGHFPNEDDTTADTMACADGEEAMAMMGGDNIWNSPRRSERLKRNDRSNVMSREEITTINMNNVTSREEITTIDMNNLKKLSIVVGGKHWRSIIVNGEYNNSELDCTSVRAYLPPAPPLVARCAGWESGRQLPIEDMPGKYWESVKIATEIAMGKILPHRRARVYMIQDKEIKGKKEITLFVDFAVEYDVIMIRNDLDILLIDGTSEVDYAMRKSLENDGFPAAMNVLREVWNIVAGTPLFEWIIKKCKVNPIDQKESPGITVDFGLHVTPTSDAFMLLTVLKNNILPSGTQYIRAKTYNDHREKFLDHFAKRKRNNVLTHHRMSMSNDGNTGETGVMLPQPRMNSFPSRYDDVAKNAALVEGLC